MNWAMAGTEEAPRRVLPLDAEAADHTKLEQAVSSLFECVSHLGPGDADSFLGQVKRVCICHPPPIPSPWP